MFNKVKPMLFSCIAFVGMFVAIGGIHPTSICTFHQPELPKGYK